MQKIDGNKKRVIAIFAPNRMKNAYFLCNEIFVQFFCGEELLAKAKQMVLCNKCRSMSYFFYKKKHKIGYFFTKISKLAIFLQKPQN
jgi:hypothetical protein